MLTLLPLIALALPVPIPGPHVGDLRALEDAATAEARALIADGWSPTDPHAWGWGHAIEVERDGILLRVVVELDDDLEGGAFRREVAWNDHDRARLDGRRVRAALADPHGRIALVDTPCMDPFFEPVVIEAEARGAAAARLVGRALREADDLENWLINDRDQIVFDLRVRGRVRELWVDRDARGAVLAAEVRQVRGYRDDGVRYRRMGALRQAARGAVTAIVWDDARFVLRLVTAKGQFEVDELLECGA
jgi:hypothetical protein